MSDGTIVGRVAAAGHERCAPEFRMEIVYENPAAGLAALTVCERLMEQFHTSFPLHVATHSFKAIEDELRDEKGSSSVANMIFVASAGTVPTAFGQWLNRRIGHSHMDVPMALVDMTARETPNARRIHEFLKSAADVHHLDHFSKEHFEGATTISSSNSSTRTVSSHGLRHWGINE
jgi:hypothetical protein